MGGAEGRLAIQQLLRAERQAEDLLKSIAQLRLELISQWPSVPNLPAARYLLVPAFARLTGYTVKAVRRKIEEGVWIQGRHFRKAPDGHIVMDLEAYYRWVEGERF